MNNLSVFLCLMIFGGFGCRPAPDSPNEIRGSIANEISENSVKTEGIGRYLALVMKDGYYGYMDENTNEVISPRYVWAMPFSNGLACVNMQGQKGYPMDEAVYVFIRPNGTVALNRISFAEPAFFYGGFALVKDQFGKKAFIDTTGKTIITGLEDAGQFHEGLAPTYLASSKTLGFIDNTGAWSFTVRNATTIGDFYEGLCQFMSQDKHGFYKRNAIAIQPVYEEVYDFSEGLAAAKKNGQWGFINSKGDVIIPFQYQACKSFSESKCLVMTNNQYVMINREGKKLFDVPYEGVGSFHDGLAVVTNQGKSGYIDKNGKLVIPLKFNQAFDFRNGFAIVQEGENLFHINQKGQRNNPKQYQIIGDFLMPFEDYLPE